MDRGEWSRPAGCIDHQMAGGNQDALAEVVEVVWLSVAGCQQLLDSWLHRDTNSD